MKRMYVGKTNQNSTTLWQQERPPNAYCLEEILKIYSLHYGNETPALIESVPRDLLYMVHPHWYQYPAPDSSWLMSFAFFYILLGSFAFVGNSLVLILFGRRHSTRTGIDVLTANLALSDMLMACSQFPVLVVNSFHGKWTLGPVACKLYGFCGALCGTVSIITMALIALDRYFAIVHPFTGLSFSSSRGYRWSIHAWVYSLSWCVLPFCGWNSYVPEGFMISCGFDFISSDCWSRAYVILLCLAAYFGPLFVIIFCYIYIFQYVSAHEQDVRRQAKRMSIDSTSTCTIGSYRKEKQLAKIAFAIITLWLFAWTPYAVISIMGLLSMHSYLTPLGTMIPALCAKTASIYNPVVYALMHPKYKQELSFLCPKLMPKRLGIRSNQSSTRSYISRTLSTEQDRKSIASRTNSTEKYGPRSPANLLTKKESGIFFAHKDVLSKQPLTKSVGHHSELPDKRLTEIPGSISTVLTSPPLYQKSTIYRKPKETSNLAPSAGQNLDHDDLLLTNSQAMEV
ncbi:hypothetical protein QYM36_000759 [Artemia franciscana]|uniref:G-protein coupled receptors family 1 profile domain-containing protein n=1 Tax=Artemia franciscana TaxID=6661 RepID=A0AA88IDS3_ARTSF|nr:hypothetical protein QYM36_000759 [Artemia franciscana]